MKKLVTLLLFAIPFAFIANAQIKVECLSGNCVNGKGIKKYADGSAYDGEFLDSLRNGFGVLVWQTGDKYIGDWKAGEITGKGTMIYTDGRRYEGDFFNNQLEGKGTMIYKDGSKYIGDWKADKRNGKGWLEFINKTCVYEGDFVNNLFEGKGTIEWVGGSEWKGDKYIGDFKTGKRSGRGKYLYADGDWYEGDFIDGLFNGVGTMSYKDGSKYSGGYKKGLRNGKGKYTYANGTIEEGDFENDKFVDLRYKSWTCVSGDCQNGIGTYNYGYDTSVTYTGQWKNGKETGEGVYKDFGGTYKGQMIEKKRDGYGTYTDNIGRTYTGNWKNDAIVDGTFTNGKGTIYTGQFRQDKFNYTEYDGEGTEIDGRAMGLVIKSKRENGMPVGKWVEIYPNGFYIEKIYKNNKVSDEKYFDNKSNKISKEEFSAKTPHQICASGNCYNGVGICEYNYGKHLFIGYWVNGKKEGFVADFESASNYYYGIWKADTLVEKIDDKEAEKYLTTNAKLFLNLLNSNNTFAAATSLIENCTGKTCTSGDCKNGFGTWVNCKGSAYTGNFANGKFHGKGKLSYTNGDVYDGNWVNDVKQGKGRYTWNDGTGYDGDWVNNTWEGKGVYTWKNGDVYNGDWVNGVQQGKGEMTWQGKEYYIGDWVNGVRQGKGRSRDTEGRIKEGDWVNDKFIISEEQEEINADIRYKIKQLKEALERSRQSYLNAVSPNRVEEMEAYKRAREAVLADIKYMESEIYRLSKQIIE